MKKTNNKKNSELFALNGSDAIKGLQMFVITAVLMSIAHVVLSPYFDVFSTDWLAVGREAINVAIVSTVSYLVKNMLTNKQGELLKKE